MDEFLRSLERAVLSFPDDGMLKINLWEAQRRVGLRAVVHSG